MKKKEVPDMSDENQLHCFQCNVCGYIYKTQAEELPEDFECPLCQAGREQFTKIEDRP